MTRAFPTDVPRRRHTPAVSSAPRKSVARRPRLKERVLRFYSANLARWLSRDPIEESGFLLNLAVQRGATVSDSLIDAEDPLYVFVLNDPGNMTDLFGLYTLREASDEWAKTYSCKGLTGKKLTKCQNALWKGHSDKAKFNLWYTMEKTQGAWWSSLPKCPKKLEKCTKLGAAPGLVPGLPVIYPYPGLTNPDPSKWNDPKTPSSPEANLHPGAIFSMRSKPDSNNHANQCTYDTDGDLLTAYPGAGTVDWYKPGTKTHYLHDVDPIYLANKLDGGASSWGLFPPNFPTVLTSPGACMNQYYQVRPLHPE